MSNKTQFGPWLGFVNSGRFKQKGFEKNHPVIILSVGDNGYGPACRVVGLYEWWTNNNAVGLWPVQYVKASGIDLIVDHPQRLNVQTLLDGGYLTIYNCKNEKLTPGDMPGPDLWPIKEAVEMLLRMSHNWSSEWQEKFMSHDWSKQANMENLLVAQGYMKDQAAAEAMVWFYGQVVRDTDKAYLVSVGPDKEEHWFAKSQTKLCGHLRDRPQQSILLTKQWQLKSKVGDSLCDVFVKADKAIRKHGIIDAVYLAGMPS